MAPELDSLIRGEVTECMKDISMAEVGSTIVELSLVIHVFFDGICSSLSIDEDIIDSDIV